MSEVGDLEAGCREILEEGRAATPEEMVAGETAVDGEEVQDGEEGKEEQEEEQ